MRNLILIGFVLFSVRSFQKTASQFQIEYSPLEGVELFDPAVLKAAKVAVDDHNREMNTNLEFLTVEKGAFDFEYYYTYYLLLRVKDHGDSSRQKLFQTAVWCIPRINFYKSVPLEYVGEANDNTALLPPPPPPLTVDPDIVYIAHFAVDNHNRNMHSSLELGSIVDERDAGTLSNEYSTYYFTLTVHDVSVNKSMLVQTHVVKHENLKKFYESPGLVHLSDLDPHSFPQTLAPESPPLMDADTKALTEFAVESHNRRMGTQFEFVDTLKMAYDSVGDDELNYKITLQVIDRGQHKIFKTLVLVDSTGPLESTGLEFVSNAKPKQKAELYQPYDITTWFSPVVISKARDKFKMGLVDQHKQDVTRWLSTIALDLKEGKDINIKLIPFLCDSCYNLIDDDSRIAMLAELEEFIHLVDGDSASHTVLIPILTTLCKFKDPSVRENAVALLSHIAERMKESNLLAWFVPLVKGLANDKSYAGRISSSGLLHIPYSTAPKELKAELRLLYSQLTRDNIPAVRRSATLNLKSFAATSEMEHLKIFGAGCYSHDCR